MLEEKVSLNFLGDTFNKFYNTRCSCCHCPKMVAAGVNIFAANSSSFPGCLSVCFQTFYPALAASFPRRLKYPSPYAVLVGPETTIDLFLLQILHILSTVSWVNQSVHYYVYLLVYQILQCNASLRHNRNVLTEPRKLTDIYNVKIPQFSAV